MSESDELVPLMPLPTFSLSGAGEASSEGGAVQSELTRFPFPPEPPGLNSLQVPESPVPSVAVPPEEEEQESPGPWDLLREISEVDVDSLRGHDFEPPSPSYVHSYDMESWEWPVVRELGTLLWRRTYLVCLTQNLNRLTRRSPGGILRPVA